MKHPAGTHHYDGAKDEEVIAQLMGMGPSTTTRVNPNEGLFGAVAAGSTDYEIAEPIRTISRDRLFRAYAQL